MGLFHPLLLRVITVAMLTSATVFGASRADYLNISKRELVRRLGLPAEITLVTSGDAPAQEIWWYYYDDPQLGLMAAPFCFKIQSNHVLTYPSDFDAKRLVSTETPQGFARVYAKVLKERKHKR